MSTAAPRNAPLAERLSDWLNPIFIKETRQALKSRQFVATFFLMLVSAWLVAMLGMLMSGSRVDGRSGQQQFAWYFSILCVTTYIIVPFGAFRSLLSERDLFTYEVLAISTLSPRQIVWGKLQSALLQTFVYYSAITPFMAFTYQLRGIDVITILFLLILALLESMALSLACLTISTFARQRAVQILTTLSVIGGLVMAFSTNIGMVAAIFQFPPPFDRLDFWMTWVVVLSYYAAYSVLLLELAVTQLTFEADNRSTSIRLAVGGIFWLSVAWLCVLSRTKWTPEMHPPLLMLFFIGGIIHWTVLGLFAVTEPDELSRRAARSVTWLGPFRILLAPLFPGGARGLMYVLGHIAATGVLTLAFSTVLDDSRNLLWPDTISQLGLKRFTVMVLSVCLYAAIYLSLACALGRWLPRFSPDLRPAHARVFTILFAAVVAVVPKLILVTYTSFPSNTVLTLYMLGDPASTASHLASITGGDDHFLVLWILGSLALLGLIVNARALFGGVAAIAKLKKKKAPTAISDLPVAEEIVG